MNHCNLYYHMSLSKKKKKNLLSYDMMVNNTIFNVYIIIKKNSFFQKKKKTKNKNFYKYINVKQIENAFKYMTLILHYLFYIKLYTLKFFK